MNKALLIGVIVLVVAAVGGYVFYSSSQQVPSQQTQTQQPTQQVNGNITVEIKDYKYSPATIKVKPGEKITVINRDIVGHTLTSTTEGVFDSGMLGKDESGSITAPTEAGTYAFHCTPHPIMTGTLVVEE
jgi:plastocyanin